MTSTGRLVYFPPAIPLVFPGRRIYGFGNPVTAPSTLECVSGGPNQCPLTSSSISILHPANKLTRFASFLKIGLWPAFASRQVPRMSKAAWAISCSRVFTRTDLGCPFNVPHNIMFLCRIRSAHNLLFSNLFYEG